MMIGLTCGGGGEAAVVNGMTVYESAEGTPKCMNYVNTGAVNLTASDHDDLDFQQFNGAQQHPSGRYAHAEEDAAKGSCCGNSNGAPMGLTAFVTEGVSQLLKPDSSPGVGSSAGVAGTRLGMIFLVCSGANTLIGCACTQTSPKCLQHHCFCAQFYSASSREA